MPLYKVLILFFGVHYNVLMLDGSKNVLIFTQFYITALASLLSLGKSVPFRNMKCAVIR